GSNKTGCSPQDVQSPPGSAGRGVFVATVLLHGLLVPGPGASGDRKRVRLPVLIRSKKLRSVQELFPHTLTGGPPGKAEDAKVVEPTADVPESMAGAAQDRP